MIKIRRHRAHYYILCGVIVLPPFLYRQAFPSLKERGTEVYSESLVIVFFNVKYDRERETENHIRKDGKNRKRKLAIAALAFSMMVSSIAPSTAMVAHAAENDEIGDILDDVFGGNKPDNSGGTGSGHIENEAGGGLIEDNGGSNDSSSSDNSGSNDNGGSDDSGSNDNSGNSGNSGSDNSGSSDNGGDDIGDILDDIFGGNKPDNSGGTGSGHIDNEAGGGLIEDNNSGSNTGNSGNSGSSNSGNTGSNAGNSTTVTDPDTGKTTTTTVNADGSTTVVTTDPATGETTSVIAPPAASSIAVDVIDPAILAVMPEAMVVTSHTSGIPFVHALDATRTSYNVWSDGYLVDAFYITDAAGAFVPMQAVDIVPSADGKVYVNVTVDPSTVGATVQAAEEQRVAFAKHFGIDGVMINGVLTDTFVALAA